jgi:hypothetical protein
LVGKKRDGLGHHVGGTQDFDETRVHVSIATERLNVDCGGTAGVVPARFHAVESC